MEKEKKPNIDMKTELHFYQEQFGEDFTVHDLLLLHDIQAKEKLNEAIYRFPKRFQKQLDDSMALTCLNDISESIDDLWITIELFLAEQKQKKSLAESEE